MKSEVRNGKCEARRPKSEWQRPNASARRGGVRSTTARGELLTTDGRGDELGVMMKVTHWLKAPSIFVVCCCLGLGWATGQAAEESARGGAQAGVIELTREELLDHIRGGWTGMLIGGIEGLAHEFKYIREPRASLPEYRFLPEGARSDDDNDFEWTHLWFMDKEGTLKLGCPRIVEIWKANMNRGLWAANRQARKLMDEGVVPPETANPARNPYAPYNLSGQFCVEA